MAHLVDCHAHLDLLPDAAAAVAAARAAGVDSILAVGIDLGSSRQAITYARQFPTVRAAIGIHPHGAATVDSDAMKLLSSLAAESEVVAIGETGLDFYRDRAPRHVQEEAFRRHIDLAGNCGLPLIVHSRDSSAATLDILAEAAAGVTIILHCFAMVDQVDECARRGYYMSIAGNVTFRNAEDLQDAASRLPEHLLLTETDAPYLAPVPLRGKPGSPACVVHTIEHIASLRSTSVAALAPIVLANYRRAFGL